MKQVKVTSPNYIKLLAEFEFDRRLKCKPTAANEAIRQITEFLSFLEAKGIYDIKKVNYGIMNVDYVKGYLITRLNRHGTGVLSQKTVSHHVTNLGKLNDYLLQEKYVDENWGRYKFGNVQYNERQSATLEEIHLLFDACESSFERALLAVSYGLGLRRAEIVNLNIYDVMFRDGFIVIQQGKFMKRREVVMSEKVQGYIQEYASGERLTCIANNTEIEPGFFVNFYGKRMSGSSLSRRFKAIVARTENEEIIKKGLCLHSMRHSLAEHLFNNGAGWSFIEEVLGHANSDSSYRYFQKKRNRNKNKKTVIYG